MRHLLLLSMMILGVLLAGPAPAMDLPAAQRAFVQGAQAYEKGDFTAAAGLFEQAAASGLVNGRLYYNLGNAWLKADDLGRAVLWYERAKRFLPGDPELEFNLDFARSLRRDAPGETPSPLGKVLFFWRGSLPPRWLQGLSLAAAWLAGLGLGLNLFRPHRVFQGIAVAGGLALLAVLPSAIQDWCEAEHGNRGVVLAETLSVRSGLNDGATELFSLHSGTEVRIEARREGYVRIRYAPDKLGWAESAAVAELWPAGGGIPDSELKPAAGTESQRTGTEAGAKLRPGEAKLRPGEAKLRPGEADMRPSESM